MAGTGMSANPITGPNLGPNLPSGNVMRGIPGADLGPTLPSGNVNRGIPGANLGGGAGGGGTTTPAPDPGPATPDPVTFQPFLPGYDTLLAQQLAQGFGGTPQSFLDSFEQFYRPMTIPNFPPRREES